MINRACSSALILCLVAGVSQAQTTVELGSAKDNTLYQHNTGALSNGSGSHMFTGLTVGFSVHRAVIEFDIAAVVPAGATIESVELSLEMSRSITPASDVTLHRAQQEWGEGASNASGEEGGGAAAADGDCTWIHAVYDTGGDSIFWTNAGGDFNPAASATASVYLPGRYTWSSAQMAAEVQSWLDDPESNHGWLMQGDEEVPSSKRFNTRNDTNQANRPILRVTYTVDEGCPADFTGDEMLDFFDVQAFLQAFSQKDPSADFTEDGKFDFFDVQAFLQAFSAGCP